MNVQKKILQWILVIGTNFLCPFYSTFKLLKREKVEWSYNTAFLIRACEWIFIYMRILVHPAVRPPADVLLLVVQLTTCTSLGAHLRFYLFLSMWSILCAPPDLRVIRYAKPLPSAYSLDLVLHSPHLHLGTSDDSGSVSTGNVTLLHWFTDNTCVFKILHLWSFLSHSQTPIIFQNQSLQCGTALKELTTCLV